MASSSSPSTALPPLQDTLLELYNGRNDQRQKRQSLQRAVNHQQQQLQQQQQRVVSSENSQVTTNTTSSPSYYHYHHQQQATSSTNNTIASIGSSDNSTSSSSPNNIKRKKRLGASYRFLPMVSRLRNNGGRNNSSSSDSDSEEDGSVVVGNQPVARQDSVGIKTNADSDQEMLKQIFSSGSGSATTQITAPSRGETWVLMNREKQIDPSESTGGCYGNGGKGPLHLERDNNSIMNSNNIFPSLNGSSTQTQQHLLKGKQPFKSRLGRRIWRNYQQQLQEQRENEVQSTQKSASSSSLPPAFAMYGSHLLSDDFLRLPSSLVPIQQQRQNNSNSINNVAWLDLEELERIVLQSHLDYAEQNNNNTESVVESPLMQAMDHFQSSPLLTSECFTRLIHRDTTVGMGMSLREYDGCVYVLALLRRDGTRMKVNSDNYLEDRYLPPVNHGNEDEGPAYLAGLRPGDRLLGLNGQPFLKGRLAASSPLAANNGSTLNSLPRVASPEEVLKSVADAISKSPSPLVVHVQRESDRASLLSRLERYQFHRNGQMTSKHTASEFVSKGSLGSTSSVPNGLHNKSSPPVPQPKGSSIHPFAKAMAERNLIDHGREEIAVTQQIRIFTDRTRQWESKLSFRLRASDFKLRPLLDARDIEPSYYASFFTDDGDVPPFFDYKYAKIVRPYAPSTPMIQDRRLARSGDALAASPVRPINQQMSREAAVLSDLYAGLDEDDAEVQDLFLGGNAIGLNGEGALRGGGGGLAYPSNGRITRAVGDLNDVFVPLVGVRKAINVRILNSFTDSRNRTAFTIWTHDNESGKEWYAPVRYYSDFKELRLAIIRLDKTISDIPFPSLGWAGFGLSNEARDSANVKEARRNQLEIFLRRVFAGVYRARLHPYLAEVAVHLQTFVGCDAILSDYEDSGLALNHQVAINETVYCKRAPNAKSEPDNSARLHLKRSIQRYVYRIFLLPSVETLVTQYVDAARKKVLSEVTTLNTKQKPNLFKLDKDAALSDVEKIRDFMDQVQDLILEGCHEDFVSISQRRDFAAFKDDVDNITRDDLFREAVREQVEIEVYVPLRSTISKYLVYAWFNEDVEMKHKTKALENKPQSYFKIQPEHRSRSDWKSVSTILEEGVGRSTLPCVKLRAIVDAAKEITRLDSEERSCFPEKSFFDAPVLTKTVTLGADDFLPIFIFCFVQAKIERPCALCALLQTMCDPLKLNGETGYYLASFQAAMTHIAELDLTEANNDLSIFLDTLP
ncbi:predicted protein [Thalassiosira pseudonana CCMP1335]|uniref:VPS9 domain-containing protein n=1 Tax=Thalassiosira pseudonana TaxID=35128 RepID=B8CFG0_THAPS|nr:predicted protein [Thalassiosira pseudonana CCMP1335]EED87793.1 predicted protein [Thalassiosira pseudonana CCMP1335]|eukprot:g9022.t1 g9022   contig34:655805-659626(+)